MQEKKKIGIVTLHGYYNYGNRLQNYALKMFLEKFGYDVTTTIIEDNNMSVKIKNKQRELLIKSLFTNPFEGITQLKQIYNNKKEIVNANQITREKIFKGFSEQYLKEKEYELTISEDVDRLSEYSFFVTGSDQVWNPIYYNWLPLYFLCFTSKEKRIAYAPSISREELPNEYKNDYKKWLMGMSAVSVREEAGSKIIRDLTGIEAPVLVDPTLLLNKNEWLLVSNRALNRVDTPYLLTYFLGGPTDNTRRKLEEIADEKNMKIINLGDITEEDTYITGPREFIDYINNASAFFTDSFHGVVFSIILQTPFVVYERQYSGPSMYSRIETILDNFDMKDREANGFDKDIFSMDFSGTHEVLDKEYNKSVNYLKEAFGIEE